MKKLPDPLFTRSHKKAAILRIRTTPGIQPLQEDKTAISPHTLVEFTMCVCWCILGLPWAPRGRRCHSRGRFWSQYRLQIAPDRTQQTANSKLSPHSELNSEQRTANSNKQTTQNNDFCKPTLPKTSSTHPARHNYSCLG